MLTEDAERQSDSDLLKELHQNQKKVKEQQSKIKGNDTYKYYFKIDITSIVYIGIST